MLYYASSPLHDIFADAQSMILVFAGSQHLNQHWHAL